MQLPKIKDLKPGDKFTAEFTVDDKYKATNGALVSYSRIDDYSSIFYKMEPLSVTQAPREPKVGDKFYYNDSTNVKTILFIDDKTVFYRFDYHNNQHHSYASRASWNRDAHLV